MDPQLIISLFDPEHVLSLILFLVFVGSGIFFFRNWGDIRDLMRYKIDSKKEVELAKTSAEREQSRKLNDLAEAMAAHTLQSSRMEAKISVLIESMDRLFRKLLNGESKKNSVDSGGRTT